MRGSEAVGAGRRRGIAGAVSRWFLGAGRELPWRVWPRDPYLSLLSEFMLQQTQVSRVIEKFGPFVERFPTLGDLAAARLDDVLAMWSGMGYYRRARSLHAAAGEVVARFGGRVPEDEKELATLPGVGRYTAGAVASIVFGRAVPIVDGNVARVLMRVEGKDFAHGSADGMEWAWGEAERLVAERGRARVGALNEGLMELGARVCVPRGPKCGECPLREVCRAAAEGKQEEIPRAKARVKRSVMECEVVVVRDGKGRVLVERRPDEGMWAGLWQAPTWERGAGRVAAREVAEWVGAEAVVKRERFEFQTTHRDVRFTVWEGVGVKAGKGRRLVTAEEIAELGISNAQRRVLLAWSKVAEAKGGGKKL